MMAIFDGLINEHGDVIEQTGADLNKIMVTKLEGGVGAVVGIPENPGDILDDDAIQDMTALMLEVTTSDGTMHRLLFREAAVSALNNMVGDYVTIMLHDMVQDGDAPPELTMLMDLFNRMRGDLDDEA
ncbi:MAG: hypothetical protein ACXQS1_02095 [Methermicoccaceae archaeon]